MLNGYERTQLLTMHADLTAMLNRQARQLTPEDTESLESATYATYLDIELMLAQVDRLLQHHAPPAVRGGNADLRVTPDLTALDHMTANELEGLQKAWYQMAEKDGIMHKCRLVAEYLGRGLGSYYTFKHGKTYPGQRYDQLSAEFVIKIHDGVVMAHWHQQPVLSTRAFEYLFIPGEWVKIVDVHAETASMTKVARETARVEKERLALVAKLGGSHNG